jgi:hypothetical protein
MSASLKNLPAALSIPVNRDAYLANMSSRFCNENRTRRTASWGVLPACSHLVPNVSAIVVLLCRKDFPATG